MTTEHSQPAKSNGTPTIAQSQQRPAIPIEYDSLIRQYGEAMSRIGQLEAQLHGLMRNVQEARAGSVHDVETQPAAERLSSAPAESQKGGDVAQLRVQVASLAGQLANAEDELKKYQGVRVRRRSHGHRNKRPKWMFWKSWKRALRFG